MKFWSFVSVVVRVAVTLAVLSEHATAAVAVPAPPVLVDVFGAIKLPGGQSLKTFPQLQSQPAASITLHSASVTIKTVAKSDGSFVIHRVPVGIYMLTVEFAHLMYPLVRVSVLETRTNVVRIRALINDASQSQIDGDGTIDAPIEISALGRIQYFVPREEYSILSFFKNPMMIMMVVSVGMMGLMKLVPQEELKQQMKEMNKQVAESKQQLGIDKKSQ